MIAFSYHPRFADYLAFNRYALWKILRMPAIFGMLALFAYTVGPLAQNSLNGQGSQVDPGQIAMDALKAMLPVPIVIGSIYFAIWRAWNRSEVLRSEREFEVGEDGIRVWSSSFNGFLDWRHFEYAEEVGRYFFLKTSQRAYHYFPVSAVPDRGAFVALLKSKLPKTRIKG